MQNNNYIICDGKKRIVSCFEEKLNECNVKLIHVCYLKGWMEHVFTNSVPLYVKSEDFRFGEACSVNSVQRRHHAAPANR